MTATSRSARVMRVDGGMAGWRVDRVADEEPLELRVDGTALTTTMRTPGDDSDLVVGFLFAEGVIGRADHILAMHTCADRASGRHNVVDVSLRGDAPGAAGIAPRAFPTSSACGVCGTATAEAVVARSGGSVGADPLRVSPAVLTGLPAALRGAQRGFEATGGLHAAALAAADGTLLCVREDVGRHNAVDKVVGWAARAGRLPLAGCVLVVSGRASFELTQKALVAGIPCLAAVSAPSSLAVELARQAGMTLVGFLRGASMNVYAGHARVTAATAAATG